MKKNTVILSIMLLINVLGSVIFASSEKWRHEPEIADSRIREALAMNENGKQKEALDLLRRGVQETAFRNVKIRYFLAKQYAEMSRKSLIPDSQIAAVQSKIKNHSAFVDMFLRSGEASAEDVNYYNSGQEILQYLMRNPNSFSTIAKESRNTGNTENISVSEASSNRIGVWICNVDSTVMDSKENIENAMIRIKELGFDSVYPVVWNKEYAFYRSETVRNLFGEKYLNAYGERDVLAEFVELGKKYNLQIFPWFEYGLKVIVAKGTDEGYELSETGKILQEKGWLTVDQNGKIMEKCEWGYCKGYLNPRHPEVIDFLSTMFTEISSYEVDGIMIDDHFSLRSTLGFDEMSRNMFLQKYQLKEPQKSGRENNDFWHGLNLQETENKNQISPAQMRQMFTVFRKDGVTELIALLAEKTRAAGKKFILAPGGLINFSRDKWLQDWLWLAKNRQVDEIIVQAYRYDVTAFTNMINSDCITEARSYLPVGLGLLSGLKNNNRVDGDLMLKQAKIARQKGYGISYFFFDTIDSPAIGKETKDQRKQKIQELTELWKKQ